MMELLDVKGKVIEPAARERPRLIGPAADALPQEQPPVHSVPAVDVRPRWKGERDELAARNERPVLTDPP